MLPWVINIGEITRDNFFFHNYCRLTGRGLAVIGKISNGAIAHDNFISICQILVKIKSVEFVRVPGGELTGLILDIAEGNWIETQLDKLKGQPLSI